jgi:hypothetical protein
MVSKGQDLSAAVDTISSKLLMATGSGSIGDEVYYTGYYTPPRYPRIKIRVDVVHAVNRP